MDSGRFLYTLDHNVFMLRVNLNPAVFLVFLISFSDIMNNKVFYQHPNLMRILGMHETVMEVMVNVLGGDKSQVCPVSTFTSCYMTEY